MKLRAPSVPLITVDPYFSVWSPADTLNSVPTAHWTDRSTKSTKLEYGEPHPRNMSMLGVAEVDGVGYRFMGVSDIKPIKQLSLDIDALTTTYIFGCDEVTVKAEFITPLLPDDADIFSRPVSYLKLSHRSADGKKHNVRFRVSASEELCLDHAGQYPVVTEEAAVQGAVCMKMGSAVQNVLNRSGDDVRIDWGYFYLAAKGRNAVVKAEKVSYYCSRMKDGVNAEKKELDSLTAIFDDEGLVVFAYDDIKSMEYFGKHLTSYWNRNGLTVEKAISKAVADYRTLSVRCHAFSDRLFIDACKAGGEQYAELLSLAYRQAFAAHKAAVDDNGELLFVSKECFSNGCAATVDVSYPSIPLFLLYNPELVNAMMRPVFRYAGSDEWKFDFAPHDVGQYPLLNGQVYGLQKDGTLSYDMQMPVEECGNMLIMCAASAIASQSTAFVRNKLEVLEKWAEYLLRYGQDPENQLCTDDFAGHLAHNCNLSLKAIMGIAALSLIFGMCKQKKKARQYMAKAREMAAVWCRTAASDDGTYRLAFDREGSFSMKYNAVWDKLFGTEIFPKEVIASEIAGNFSRFRKYGMPLDNRAEYTKSDWMVWTATMCRTDDDFRRFISPLWDAYNCSPTRVPMTDWFDTVTSEMVGFQNRTVQGGLFIKLLEKDFVEKSKTVLRTIG